MLPSPREGLFIFAGRVPSASPLIRSLFGSQTPFCFQVFCFLPLPAVRSLASVPPRLRYCVYLPVREKEAVDDMRAVVATLQSEGLRKSAVLVLLLKVIFRRRPRSIIRGGLVIVLDVFIVHTTCASVT